MQVLLATPLLSEVLVPAWRGLPPRSQHPAASLPSAAQVCRIVNGSCSDGRKQPASTHHVLIQGAGESLSEGGGPAEQPRTDREPRQQIDRSE